MCTVQLQPGNIESLILGEAHAGQFSIIKEEDEEFRSNCISKTSRDAQPLLMTQSGFTEDAEHRQVLIKVNGHKVHKKKSTSRKRLSVAERERSMSNSHENSCQSEMCERSLVRLAITPANAEEPRSPYVSQRKLDTVAEPYTSDAHKPSTKKQPKVKASTTTLKKIGPPFTTRAHLPLAHPSLLSRKRQRSFCESTVLKLKRLASNNSRERIENHTCSNSRLANAKKLLESFKERHRSNDRRTSIEKSLRGSDSESNGKRKSSLFAESSWCRRDEGESVERSKRHKIKTLFLKQGNF